MFLNWVCLSCNGYINRDGLLFKNVYAYPNSTDRANIYLLCLLDN